VSAGVQTDAARVLALAVASFSAAVAEVDRAVGSIDSTTKEEAIELLRALRENTSTARMSEAGIERWIAVCFREEGLDSNQPHDIPGCGVVEVRRSRTRRAWQWDTLKPAWLNAVIDQYADANDGLEPPTAYVRDSLFDCFSISGAKVRSMASLGIDVDTYCDSTPGTPTVVLA
jgi:hypothetical protein